MAAGVEHTPRFINDGFILTTSTVHKNFSSKSQTRTFKPLLFTMYKVLLTPEIES